MPFHISQATFEHEVKKSRFISFIKPIASPNEFKAWQNEVKQSYPDARHWVSCCLLGAISNPDWLLLDDDGEPANTAAKPLLNVITHNDLCDVGLIVVRYFGGIKLGAGGLVRAYGAAATGVVDLCIKTPVQLVHHKILNIEFSEEASVRHLLNMYSVAFDSHYNENGVALHLSMTEKQERDLSLALNGVFPRYWAFNNSNQ